MEDFSVHKFYRSQLFEQEDQLEPEDDSVDSAFTKEPEVQPEPQSEPEMEPEKADDSELANLIDKIEMEIATKLKENLPDINDKVLNKGWVIDSVKQVKNSSGKYEIDDDVNVYYGVNLYEYMIAHVYLNKFFLPSLDKPYRDDINEVLEHLGYLFDDDGNLAGATYTFYKQLPLWQNKTINDKYVFDDKQGFLVKR